MMVSTHMAYGFVFASLLTFILVQATNSVIFLGSSGYFAILGALGGAFPDLDRIEWLGMAHRKTLHYVVGWGVLTLILIGVRLVGCACFFSGAWLHSLMDVFDDFYKDPEHGVYEHFSRKWIRPLRYVPFASLWEWSLQSFCMVCAMAISPFLSGAFILRGWGLTALNFFVIWLLSTVYEFKYSVPKRRALINEALKRQAGM
jgi:hypothetical protein